MSSELRCASDSSCFLHWDLRSSTNDIRKGCETRGAEESQHSVSCVSACTSCSTKTSPISFRIKRKRCLHSTIRGGGGGVLNQTEPCKGQYTPSGSYNIIPLDVHNLTLWGAESWTVYCGSLNKQQELQSRLLLSHDQVGMWTQIQN